MSESMPSMEPSTATVRSGGWKRLGMFLILIVGAVGVLYTLRPAFRWLTAEVGDSAEGQPLNLAGILAELDQGDPDWRFGDLEKNRILLADDQNAARVVLAAGNQIPEQWPDKHLTRQLQSLQPPQVLSIEQYLMLQKEMTKVDPALTSAERLADLSLGRFDVTWTRSYLTTPLPHLHTIRRVAGMLGFAGRLHLQERDLPKAVRDVHGILNAGRSVGDEPMLPSQLTRLEMHLLATRLLERILAQGEPSPDTLQQVRQVFQNEASQPLLTITARGLRGGMHGLLLSIEQGELHLADLDEAGSQQWSEDLTTRLRTLLGDQTLRRPEHLVVAHAWLLHFLTEFIQVSGLSVEQQRAALSRLAATTRTAPPAAVPLILPIREIDLMFRRSQALLRCAVTTMAVECYRQTRKKWPDNLQNLVPDYLPAVPLDPFDGELLRCRQYPEGFVIYSIGSDGKDDGGRFAELNTFEPRTDQGLRLWNVKERRQATALGKSNQSVR